MDSDISLDSLSIYTQKCQCLLCRQLEQIADSKVLKTRIWVRNQALLSTGNQEKPSRLVKIRPIPLDFSLFYCPWGLIPFLINNNKIQRGHWTWLRWTWPSFTPIYRFAVDKLRATSICFLGFRSRGWSKSAGRRWRDPVTFCGKPWTCRRRPVALEARGAVDSRQIWQKSDQRRGRKSTNGGKFVPCCR